MINEADKFWREAEADLARKAGLGSLTPQEAQKEFEELPDMDLPDSEIESIIEQVVSGELAIWTPEPIDAETSDTESEAIEEDVYQLNRNAGERDVETDELLDDLRRKALEDGPFDGRENETGTGGNAEPPREGD